MNRKLRRAQAALARKTRRLDPTSVAAKAFEEKLREAQSTAQRYDMLAQVSLKALQVASTIEKVDVAEGETIDETHPNSEREKVIGFAKEIHEEAKRDFVNALLDVCDVIREIDEPSPDIAIVPATALPR